MPRISRVFLLVGLFAVALAGCIFKPDTVDPPPPVNEFVTNTAPESLVVNLQVAYRTRRIGEYADLLAPEFRFYFQPVDQAVNGEYWNRDQDSTGTDGLFRTNQVSSIRIELLHGPAEDPTEVGFDPDVKKIRINTVNLEVDQSDGTTLLVTDLQDMYFRPGREAAGEDTTRWFLLEWRDVPSAGAPRIAPLSAGEGSTGGETRAVSWGQLLSEIAPGN